MSVEEDTTKEGDDYSGFLDNFGSEIGSTLEDLVSDWNEGDYDTSKDDIENIPKQTVPIKKTQSSFKTRLSMETLEGMTDLSLKKARPLAFANPVYDLVNIGGIVTRPRQMTLIPLSQFDINKRDGGKPQGKHKPHKRGSHGLINKISNTIRKHHSMKKQEQEMNVTAPLWTDVPAAMYNEPVKRTTSLRKNSVENDPEKDDGQKERSSSLGVVQLNETVKSPPEDGAKESRSNSSPAEDAKTQNTGATPVRTGSLELPSDKLHNADSNSSIASDISSEGHAEEERPSKTMMEVMNEINDEPANEDDINQQKNDDSAIDENENQEKFEENGETSLLKRNKTLKWSGSRSAPALIREFTRKSRKVHNRQEAPAISESTETAQTPTKTIQNEEATTTESTKKTHISKFQGNQTKTESPGRTVQKVRDNNAFTVLSCLLPPAPKLRRTESTKIRTYISRMGTNAQNPLGYATTEFVRQTMNSKEQRPVVLLHTVRSFQTDIKRYMISNPHLPFMVKILKIVKNAAIIDIEGAIDDALERLILYPLRDFIYKRLVRDYAKSGKISVVEDAIKVGKTKSLRELGIRSTLIPPGDDAMGSIRHHFNELQMTFSPYYKLKHLLSAVTTIYENTSDLTCDDKSARKIGADDFLPLLVHSIIKCDFTAADIEAQYIDGLLDPTLLLGEGGYYLTTLISAVQVLSSMKTPLPNIADLQGFLKVGISSKSENASEKTNEDEETLLLHKTLHVPPSMTSHNLGLMIAKKYGIKDTKNYCLHVVVNGIAYPLKPQEFPQLVKMDLLTQFQSNSFYFVYRQIAKTPEKTAERPTTMDSEHLKVNTEQGENVEITADVINEDVKDSSEESGRDEDQLDNLPPPIAEVDEDIQDGMRSPGFADIPLPDSLVFNMEAAAFEQDATISHSDSKFPHPEVTDAITSSDTKYELADDLPPPDDVLLESDEQISALDSTITPLDTTIMQLEDDLPLPDDDIPASDVTLSDITHHSVDLPPPADDTPHPSNMHPIDVTNPLEAKPTSSVEVTPPVEVEISTIESDVTTLPPPPLEDLPSPLFDDFSNSLAIDTSDTDLTSEDDISIDETYHPAALVDDELSPAKGSMKNIQKKSLQVFPSVQQKVKMEENSPESVDSSSTETASDEISQDDLVESYMKSSKIPEDSCVSPEVPCVTLTDLSHDTENLSESVLSDVSSVSDGRISAGFHSDGNYGNTESRQSSRGYHSDGRRSAGSQGDSNHRKEQTSRGYHSDGHYVDDNIPSETDIGAHTSVSTLKSYFESEITKVAQDLARTVSPHSPK